MKRIFVSTPYASDGNSFWRCVGPLSYMAKNGDYAMYVHPQSVKFQWDAIAGFDMIFMHRPCRQDDVILMQMARTMNIPVWVDYDDWLFHVPEWNPAAELYNNFAMQQIMALIIATADIVSVSTACLQQEFSKLNPNVCIVPNAYRADLFPFRKEVVPPRKDFFYWRGTNTHEGDLLSVVQGLKALTIPTKFIGGPSHSVLSQMNPEMVVRQKYFDTIRYWQAIYDMCGKVMIFPLDGHYFNQCKSNIAWIEAMHAGSVIVAPDLPEWRHPGVITYTCGDSDNFQQACEQAMAMTETEIQEANQVGFAYMVDKFGIENVNKIRVALTERVLSKDFVRNTRDPFDQITGMWALSVLTGKSLPRAQGSAPQTPEGE